MNFAAEDQEQISAHLITCADCSAGFAALTAEQELFARYDREVEVPPFLWTRIAATHCFRKQWFESRVARALCRSVRDAFALQALIAILLLAIAVGVVYLISRQPPCKTEVGEKQSNRLLPRKDPDPTQVRNRRNSKPEADRF